MATSNSGNQVCPAEKEINILLLGQTGVGKSTFINAFANYLVYNSLDDAIHKKDMRVIIPGSFSYTDSDTFETETIKYGKDNDVEQIQTDGETVTQQCHSYVFPIGDRNVRLIDTPGMGSTTGVEQDKRNFLEILTYISHYEHLNGICVFLKPNEERITVAFRLYIKEILHYLHADASQNIMFIYTNARSTFFTPGTSKKILQEILKKHQEDHNIEIPFTKANTFLIDNEGFRTLAILKQGFDMTDDQLQVYKISWERSVDEYKRLLTYVKGRDLHAISGTLSLNEAEQLIRKLARPIADILVLIQRNIQLTMKYKQQQSPCEMLKVSPTLEFFVYPKLICINSTCPCMDHTKNVSRSIGHSTCNKKSYLSGVIQETINDPRFAACTTIDKNTNKCKKCECPWKYHMNVTYMIYLKKEQIQANQNDNENKENIIQKRLDDLDNEQTTIIETYIKLLKFLHLNAICPLDNSIVRYLKVYIQGEERKNDLDAEGVEKVVENLTKLKKTFEDNINEITCKQNSNDKGGETTSADIFLLIGSLYRLPIYGQLFREIINSLKIAEIRAAERLETNVDLATKASSKLYWKIDDILNSRYF